MNFDFRGKRALVCGSTQGIGKAIAVRLAALGAEITLFSRNEAKLRDTLRELDGSHGQAHDYLAADFEIPQSVKEELSKYMSQKGKAVHILVNNTGGPPPGPVAEAKPSDFVEAIAAHLISSQHLVQAVLPGMKEAGFGRIINVISTSVKAPIPGLGVSNTTRGAVASWAKTLSLEVAEFGVTVNNVLPGFTRTARLEAIVRRAAEREGRPEAEIEQRMSASVPAKRFAEPEEVAAAAVFLASEEAAYVNGVSLPVDGGRLPTI